MKKIQLMIITAALLGGLCFAACGGSEESSFDYYEDEYDYDFDTDLDYDDTWDDPAPTNTPQPTSTTAPIATPEPTTTPMPTATPTPLVNPALVDKIVGQRWMPNRESLSVPYGVPIEISIDSLTEETATVTYELERLSVYPSECIGLQTDGSRSFVVLECDVTVKGFNLILTSKKQIREFNSVSSSTDKLCTIELNTKDLTTMKCEFMTWDHELTLYEELETKTSDFAEKVIDDISSLASFQEMCAAITKDHKLYLWGNKALDCIADNPVKGTAIEPTFVMDGVKKVYSAVDDAGFIIKDDNSLWGFGRHASLSADNKNNREEYARKIADGVKDVVCGIEVVVLYENGKLGLLKGNMFIQKSRVEAIEDVVDICLGYDYLLALKADGTLWGLGDNRDHQLGMETPKEIQHEFVKLMDDVIAMETNGDNCFVIKSDGSLWAWGDNDYGQLGTWDFYGRKTPVKVMDNVATVHLDGSTVYAITGDGSLYVWGGSSPYSETCHHPVKYENRVIGVVSYFDSLMLVKDDGHLYTMGQNNNHKLGYLTDTKETNKLRLCLKDILLEK